MKPNFLKKPLTQKEIEERYSEVQDEWKIVNDWVKEEQEKLNKGKFKTHQAKSACKRNLIKAKRRVNSVRGTLQYWKNRAEGMTHFRASIILNEYWENLRKKEAEEKEKAEFNELPKLLKEKVKSN